jgi:hypothetical protein
MKRALLLFLLAGCVDELAPDVGPPTRAACVDDDSDPAAPVRYRDVEAIFAGATGHCLRCHSEDGDTPLGLEVGGLDLSEYDYLRAGGVISGDRIVVPGEPCQSVLVEKLGAGPPFGARMPLDGPPFLSDDDRRTIADWIAEGADEN